MPTYEYRCENGHDFEEFVLKMSAAKSELPCPTCGTRGERRLSAGGGLLFRGSGFYITDYGKDGKKVQPTSRPSTTKEVASAEGAKADAPKSDAKSDAKSDTKADAKSESKTADAKPAAASNTSSAPKSSE